MSKLTNPKHKYLNPDEFIELCSDMRVYRGHKPKQLLEAYEQHGLIRPVYRLHVPEGYNKIISKLNATKNEKQNISVPEVHEDIYNFLIDRLSNYHAAFLWRERTMKEGHPLDWAFKKNKPYVEKPSSTTFRYWKEYEINGSEIYGDSLYGKEAIHYYAQWQVFLLEEADSLFSIKINPFLSVKDYDITRRQGTLSFSGWINEFEILSEYRFRRKLVFESYMDRTSNNNLAKSMLVNYYDDIKKQAEVAFSKIPEDRWIKFLRKLCETYFTYEKSEKISLSNYLKSYISSIKELYQEATKISYSALVSKVGNDEDEYIDRLPLEIILPNEEKEKKRAREHFICLKDEFNTLFPSAAIQATDIDEIIEDSLSNGDGALLTSIININREFKEGNLFRHENIWNCNMSALATSIESFGRRKYRNVKYLSECVDKATSNQSQKLRKVYNDFLNTFLTPITQKIGEATNPKEFIFKFDLLKNPSAFGLSISTTMMEMKPLLIATLIRNYINHLTTVDAEFFGIYFIEFYKSLIFTLFYFKKH